MVADVEGIARGVGGIDAVVTELEAEFASLEGWSERISHLLSLGRSLPGIDPAGRREADRVHGCQSQVWLVIDEGPNILRMGADSDALIMRGLLAIVLRLYSERTPEEILSHPPDVLDRLAVGRNLAPSRSNGLHLVVKRIRSAAAAAVEKSTVRGIVQDVRI